MSTILTFINPRLSTSNVGDYFIEDSVKRILSFDRDHSIDIDTRRPLYDRDIDRINETDAAVIVGSNLYYRDMARRRGWQLTLDKLKRIRVPIIPFGVGATKHAGEDYIFEPETLEHLRLIHNSCNVGSVRDAFTAEVLEQAGSGNVSMTGCPVLFRSLKPTWTLQHKPDCEQIVVTVRKGQKPNVRCLLRELRQRGMNPIVAAQKIGDCCFRRTVPLVHRATPTLFRFDMRPYVHLIDTSRGAIGWRLHGNMLHLAHGNPAVFFANCSRAESFCESFGLPCVTCEDYDKMPAESIAEMVEHFFNPGVFFLFAQKYQEHRKRLIEFLEANGLNHNLHSEALAA